MKPNSILQACRGKRRRRQPLRKMFGAAAFGTLINIGVAEIEDQARDLLRMRNEALPSPDAQMGARFDTKSKHLVQNRCHQYERSAIGGQVGLQNGRADVRGDGNIMVIRVHKLNLVAATANLETKA